ncbi:sporulation histidine kinase inhibitor Sda [Bacillus sp. ISL-7]|nr:sporulation histidine kinase inhibitor Sda [Bacillus sp. ISL-7]
MKFTQCNKTYKKAVEQKYDKEWIEIIFSEIKRRNFRIDKPRHLKLIK